MNTKTDPLTYHLNDSVDFPPKKFRHDSLAQLSNDVFFFFFIKLTQILYFLLGIFCHKHTYTRVKIRLKNHFLFERESIGGGGGVSSDDDDDDDNVKSVDKNKKV